MGNDLFESFKRLWGNDDDNENNKNNGTTENEDDAAGTMLITSIPGVLFVVTSPNSSKKACASHFQELFLALPHFQITRFY
jgi:hypothetical protein